jgi:Ni/Co efflux regulator RcnB
MNQRRYESVFNGYCLSCNEYDHKALDCRHHGRKQFGRFNNSIRCWNCNHVGHIATHCYTMRCYSCGGFGHKSHNYCNSRKQLMRNSSYNTTKRVNETWKKNEVAVIEYQRTNFKKLGHSQMWIEKTEQVNMSEVDCCKKNVSHVPSIV